MQDVQFVRAFISYAGNKRQFHNLVMKNINTHIQNLMESKVFVLLG